VVGALGDALEPEEKGKKAKATEPLIIERCVNMTSFDIEKLNPGQMAEMKKLYQDTFDPLYIFGAGPLTGDDNNPLQFHFSRLNKAPAGKIVYRGIQEDRLNAIINQAHIQSKFNCSERVIVVLPLKLGPYGGQGQVSMYKEEPIKKNLLKDTTEFYIIGGYHTVEAHRTLVANNEIPEVDQVEASQFNVILVWCAPKEKTKLLMHSRVLKTEGLTRNSGEC
jgi:hypothetical protein